MRLDTEFIRLPLRVDARRLAREVAEIPESAWRPHPQSFAGNSALALISVAGDPTSDEVVGAMRPTPHLATCPYLTHVLHALGAPLGRTRLMRLDGNAEATRHCDINYYWFDRARVHIPVETHPDVMFQCGERSQHMSAGEAWIFDTWRAHNVINPRPTRRIHLVTDTVGSASFWSLAEAGDHVFAAARRAPAPDHLITSSDGLAALAYEVWNWPGLMAPAQVEAIVAQIRESVVDDGDPNVAIVQRSLLAFQHEWRASWAQHGDAAAARDAYRALRDRFATAIAAEARSMVLANGSDLERTVRELLLRPLVAEHASPHRKAPRSDEDEAPASLARAVARPAPNARFDRPIFIVCPPRSGSSLLFETMLQSPELWTIGGESHRIIEGIAALHPESRGFSSNCLAADDATPQVVDRLSQAFLEQLRDRSGVPLQAGCGSVRFLEKTPKNALRVPFIKRAFPDAYFIYLYRDPRDTLSSMLDAWRSGKFVTYPQLPGWQGKPWSMLLTPGWRELSGRPLPEVVARQWATATSILLDDLDALAPSDWCVASYEGLLADAQAELARICGFLHVAWDGNLQRPLPASKTTLTQPDPEKWRKNEHELAMMLPVVDAVSARARAIFAVALQPERAPRPSQPKPTAATKSTAPMDFRSVHTQSFAHLLSELQATLVVTTYQSGRVILVRADGDTLNTHLRSFPSPMGVAVAPGRLALGTQREVWNFFDMKALTSKFDPPGKHDRIYAPRNSSITGDIRVHELAFADQQLWLVNTRFSCLCTLDSEHSFVPRWRPPFVSALAAEDRCHLNGMCIVDDQVRFVTVLGQSDTPGGWRENKANGGCILEVPSGKVIAQGLSMPHSPRFRKGQLWVLESGKGEVGIVEMQTKAVRPVARLDGFTRGLAFAGPYAFVGLSQVRESNVFGGLPLTARVPERKCGVWVIDTRTGKTVAFLRFDGSVQEIFDVQILEGARYAELLEPNHELVAGTYALSREALAQANVLLPSSQS
jgi:uncharacterized protein (TIGR03032 family)